MRPLANKAASPRADATDVNRVARVRIGLMCPHGLRNMALVLISCIPLGGETRYGPELSPRTVSD